MSNEVFDAIYQRRTVRNFEDKPVSEDVLKSVLEAVKWAPSWANTQCWEVVAVTDPELKARLQQEAVPKSNPAHKAVGSAPVVLALCARLNEAGYYKGQVTTKFGDWFMFDLGIAAQNLSLAAHSLGLGSVIMGLFDQDKAAEVLKVPQNHELVSLIPMGYPSKVPSAPKRKSVEEFCRQNTF